VVFRKSSKQHKGTAVATPCVGSRKSEPVFVNNSTATPSLLVCTGIVQNSPRTDPLVATPCVGKVWGSSPTRTAPLVVHSCVGEAHDSSPSKTNLLATTFGETDIAGKSMNVPLLDVAVQCGVRTRNQKQRGHSGRVSPSPAIL